MARSKLALVGAAGALAVVAALVAVFLLRPADEPSARETAEGYFAAWKAGDVDDMCALLTAAQRDDTVRCEDGPDDEWVGSVKWLRHTIRGVEEHGDSATVRYDQVDSNPRYPIPLTGAGVLHLVKVDGAWRIDDNELVDTTLPPSD